MDASKEYLKKHDIYPSISFKEKPERTVELIKDKVDKITGNDGNPVEGIRFLVKENDEKKTFFTSSDSLIRQLSGYETGDKVKIVMKSKKREDGQFISYFETSQVEGEEKEQEVTIDDLGEDEEQKDEF